MHVFIGTPQIYIENIEYLYSSLSIYNPPLCYDCISYVPY